MKVVKGFVAEPRFVQVFRSDLEAADGSHAFLASLVSQAVAPHFFRVEGGRVAGMGRFE